MKWSWFIVLVMFCSVSSSAQNVINILREYVVIDTDVGIGQIGKTVQIQRRTHQGVVEVGTVRLLKFHEGKAAAKIVKEIKPFRIKIGDFVKDQNESEDFTRQSKEFLQPDQGKIYSIIRVVSGYALIKTDDEIGKKDDVVQIHRKTDQGTVGVGTAKLIKSKKGLLVAKIVNEVNHFHIQVGDFVNSSDVEKEIDIDYYFFDSFQPD